MSWQQVEERKRKKKNVEYGRTSFIGEHASFSIKSTTMNKQYNAIETIIFLILFIDPYRLRRSVRNIIQRTNIQKGKTLLSLQDESDIGHY
jgi:hypothetical protein